MRYSIFDGRCGLRRDRHPGGRAGKEAYPQRGRPVRPVGAGRPAGHRPRQPAAGMAGPAPGAGPGGAVRPAPGLRLLGAPVPAHQPPVHPDGQSLLCDPAHGPVGEADRRGAPGEHRVRRSLRRGPAEGAGLPPGAQRAGGPDRGHHHAHLPGGGGLAMPVPQRPGGTERKADGTMEELKPMTAAEFFNVTICCLKIMLKIILKELG